MGEELSLDNILSADEVDNLFADDVQDTSPEDKEENKEEKTEETTEITNVDTLFTEESESVGSEEIEETEDTESNNGEGASPKTNFYSSIAKALKDEGIFPDLDDELVGKAVTAEDFRDLVENQIKAGIEERQRRIDEALNVGIESNEIRRYENTLNYLDSIDDDSISDESEKGETLRKQLIYQDFINRGYTKERAEREVKKSFNAGSDIEDAKEALASNKEFFESEYNNLIEESKKEEQRIQKERREKSEKLKKSILEDKDVFGDLEIDKSMRQKVFDNISKPVYKDPDSGQLFTAIQKYERDNSTEFIKNVGLLFTLTDGFKNLDKLVKNKVRKEVKKGLRELENTLNNTTRSFDGNLQFVSGVGADPESKTSSWDIDV